MKILDAPVHLGALAESMTEQKIETSSIWIDKKDKESVCNLGVIIYELLLFLLIDWQIDYYDMIKSSYSNGQLLQCEHMNTLTCGSKDLL